MKKINLFVAAMMISVGIGVFALPVHVGAVNAISSACSDPLNKDSVICKSQNDSIKTTVGAIVNTLIFLTGLAAVIVIIIGGLRYTTSAGNEKSIEEAKNMILYAVIGLVLAFSAYAIINWVIKAFG
jgi:hypothetical protein